MISDVLSDAITNIEKYERDFPDVYGPMRARIATLKDQMRAFQREMDTSPAACGCIAPVTPGATATPPSAPDPTTVGWLEAKERYERQAAKFAIEREALYSTLAAELCKQLEVHPKLAELRTQVDEWRRRFEEVNLETKAQWATIEDLKKERLELRQRRKS